MRCCTGFTFCPMPPGMGMIGARVGATTPPSSHAFGLPCLLSSRPGLPALNRRPEDRRCSAAACGINAAAAASLQLVPRLALLRADLRETSIPWEALPGYSVPGLHNVAPVLALARHWLRCNVAALPTSTVGTSRMTPSGPPIRIDPARRPGGDGTSWPTESDAAAVTREPGPARLGLETGFRRTLRP